VGPLFFAVEVLVAWDAWDAREAELDEMRICIA